MSQQQGIMTARAWRDQWQLECTNGVVGVGGGVGGRSHSGGFITISLIYNTMSVSRFLGNPNRPRQVTQLIEDRKSSVQHIWRTVPQCISRFYCHDVILSRPIVDQFTNLYCTQTWNLTPTQPSIQPATQMTWSVFRKIMGGGGGVGGGVRPFSVIRDWPFYR
jgi:hypothetical protein